MIEFVPPKEDEKKLPKFASYCPNRNSYGSNAPFRTHTRRCDARNSLIATGTRTARVGDEGYKGTYDYWRRVYNGNCYILQLVDGRWIVREELKDGAATFKRRTKQSPDDAFAEGLRAGLALAKELAAKAA